MNILLTLAPKEVEALADWWAGKIGQGSEAESDRACARIEQLHRLTAPERRYDIEHEPAAAVPSEPTRAERMRAAGFTRRNTHLPSDE